MRDLTIGKNEAGQRMDKYLKKYFPEAGSGFLYKMLRKKNILLNEKKADGKEMLKQGDCIRLYLAEETIEKFRGAQKTPAVSQKKTPGVKLDVIYEDEHVAMVNKPAGMLSQKAKPSDQSLVEYFQRYLLDTGAISEQELETFHPAPCNRLDRNTRGLVLCGKSLAGLQALSEALKLRTMKKYYLALVLGKVDQPGHQKAWLCKDTKTNQHQADARKFSDRDRLGAGLEQRAGDAFKSGANHRKIASDPLPSGKSRLSAGGRSKVRKRPVECRTEAGIWSETPVFACMAGGISTDVRSTGNAVWKMFYSTASQRTGTDHRGREKEG